MLGMAQLSWDYMVTKTQLQKYYHRCLRAAISHARFCALGVWINSLHEAIIGLRRKEE